MMGETPSNEHLKELVNSLCELQARIVKQIGPPAHFLQSQAASVEPLKTPIHVLRQMLGYADYPKGRVQAYWLASFKTSPPDYISECITQIKNGDIPVDDLTLRRQLIDLFLELIEQYNINS